MINVKSTKNIVGGFLFSLLLILFLFVFPRLATATFEDGLLASHNGDYITAYREFRILADKGHAKAQLHLGLMYEKGLGIKQNYPEALKWYQKAAIQGNGEAQQRIIDMRKKGLTASEMPSVPSGWQGSTTEPQGQFDLGVMYFKGSGVNQDYQTAFKWFYMAANQEHVRSQNVLAVMFSRGLGVERNNAEAYQWFLKAAEKGFVDSQYNLGIMFSNRKGKGREQHLMLSYMWYEIAAENGLAEARKGQEKIVEQMSQAQIDEAKIKARQWLLKYGMKE